MNKDEALKLALEALKYISSHYMSLPKIGCMALAAIEEVLAAQKTCLVANESCKHGSWCSEVYCQEHCKFVEQPAPVAEPHKQQEPVARSKAYDMIDRFLRNNLSSDEDYAEYSTALDSLYTSPPASKPWVGLTNQELIDLTAIYSGAPLYCAIEAKLREKNDHGFKVGA